MLRSVLGIHRIWSRARAQRAYKLITHMAPSSITYSPTQHLSATRWLKLPTCARLLGSSASPFLESFERRVQVKSRNGTSHICRNVGERAALHAASSAATSCCVSRNLFTYYDSCAWSRILTSLDTQGSPPQIDAMGRDPHGGARTVAGGVGGWTGEALPGNTGSSLPSFLTMKLQNDSAQMQGGRFE